MQTASTLRTTNCWRYCRFASKFRSCKQHPSVKEPLPLEPFYWFLGDADLPQLVTRQGEHLTSGRTYLSLNPKITRVQVVSFNGAGFSLILPLYALKSAVHANNPSLQKVIPRQRRKGSVGRHSEQPSNAWNQAAWCLSVTSSCCPKHCDKQRVARCEPTEEYCSS